MARRAQVASRPGRCCRSAWAHVGAGEQPLSVCGAASGVSAASFTAASRMRTCCASAGTASATINAKARHVEPLGVSGRDVPLYGYNIRRLRGAFRFILGREFLKQFRMTARCLNRVIRVRCKQLRWSMASMGHGGGVV